jgi:hypothetical protein
MVDYGRVRKDSYKLRFLIFYIIFCIKTELLVQKLLCIHKWLSGKQFCIEPLQPGLEQNALRKLPRESRETV